MNDPKKRIDVNLSSLLSLKAELVRKREEAKNANNQQQRGQFHHHFPKLIEKKVSKSMPPPTATVSEFEDQMLLEKSRKVLESKAKFYEKMTQSGGSLNSDDNCLVMFNQKRQECNNIPSRPIVESSSDSSSTDSDDSEEEAEFIDCLGRTRKCLRKDLEKIKSQDRELSKNMPQKIDTSAANWMIDIPQNQNPPESIFTDNTSTISKHDAQKMNWEKKEEENINKPEIHYQDVFFDEARQHGTGYYAFSTDSEERKKQQQALEDMRKKTLNEQKDRESQKLQREKIIAERVRAAKNRQRARAGLPPLEEEIVSEEIEEVKEETREERKQRKKEEKRKRKKDNEEALRAEQRKTHIRPWDHNKDSISSSPKWQYKPDKEQMTQEQWNEMKRNERNSEFAPPSSKVSRSSVENSTYEARYHPDKYQMLVDKLREEKTREEPLCTPPESFVPFIPKSTQNHFTMDIEAKLKYIRQNGPNADWKRKIGTPENSDSNEPALFSSDLKY